MSKRAVRTSRISDAGGRGKNVSLRTIGTTCRSIEGAKTGGNEIVGGRERRAAARYGVG
jgi:hypothetical protein